MANFGTDLFNSLTGQQTVPQQTIIPTSDLLGQSYATAQSQIPALTTYNNALAASNAQSQLGYEAAINPYANQVRSGAYQSILDQLNLGTALPQDLQDQVVRQALQGNAASGFGLSQGGRGLVAADLGLTGLQLQNQRTGNALNAAKGLALTGAGYSPYQGYSPQTIGADIRGIQAQTDEYNNLKENIRRDNFAALLNTGGRIIGGVIGGVLTEGSPMGIEAGKNIGGSIFQGSGGYNQQQAAQGAQGSSFLTGLLGNMGGNRTGGSFGSGNTSGAISNFGNQYTSLDTSMPSSGGPF